VGEILLESGFEQLKPNRKEIESSRPKISVSYRIRKEICATLARYAANERRSVSNLLAILTEWSLVELQKKGSAEALLRRKIVPPRNPDGNCRRKHTERKKHQPELMVGTVYNLYMAKDVIHISEAEAANDFAMVMTRVREGAEVIIERDAKPVAVVRAVGDEFRPRLLSESIALAKKHAQELGYEPRMDPEFAADLEEIVRNRKPWNPPAWE